MAEQEKDAKTTTEPTIDETMDKVFDEHEASSTSKKGAEETDNQDTGVDQSKKANLDKETEAKSSPEEKLKKISEILGDDEKAIDAYIKSKGYHTDPAWQKLLAKSKAPAVDDNVRQQLEEFNKVTSSREYIELAMKSKGYTEEAINAELRKRGFQVEDKGNDFDLITRSLNIDPKSIDENARATITDISKIVDVLFKDRIGKILPTTLKPFEDNLNKITQKDNAAQLTDRMKNLIKEESVLDFEKDVEPALNEWLDKNPEATQEDVFNEFLTLNHRLSIERLKTGKKRTENQEIKKTLPKGGKQTVNMGNAPKKTGDFHTDADSLLDSLGVQ